MGSSDLSSIMDFSSAQPSPQKKQQQQSPQKQADQHKIHLGAEQDVEADFESGAVVSELFTLEEYNADDGHEENFGSVWGLNKKRSGASLQRLAAQERALANNDSAGHSSFLDN